jgi:dTDP-4-dehydrorhamnose 3,5-epimerase
MIVKKLSIPDLVIIEPDIFSDDRGYFFESFNSKDFNEIIGREVNFVQDNHSFSLKNTLRGIHYQLPPFPQGKLVRVIEGSVIDVAVDLRVSSPTFMKWEAVHLDSETKNQFWIPEGFGHGFLVLSETAHFLYKTTDYYNKESEGSVLWNDPTLNIDWSVNLPILSDKDRMAPTINSAKLFK